MTQVQTIGRASGFPKNNESRSTGLLSRSKTLLGFALLLSLQLFSGKAGAVALTTTSFSCSLPTTATSSCVTGFYATFGTTSTNYWTYTFSSSGYSTLAMSFKTSSSATGPTSALVYYNIGAGDVLFTSYSSSTSCATKSFSIPSACNNQASVTIKIKMSGGSGSGGTNRINSNGGFTGTASTFCSGTPATGSVVANPTSLCGTGTSTLTFTPGSVGADLTYQWYNGGGLVAGATNLVYVPTVTTTTTYSVVTTCPTSLGTNTATSTVVVNALPATGTIDPIVPSPVVVGTTPTLTVTGGIGGGVWTSATPTIGTIDGITGAYGSLFGGTTRVTYTVDNGTCSNSTFVDVNNVWSNTLALYAGSGGTSTSVIPVANETVSALVATGFGSNTPCASGGLSGLTVPTTVATYGSANPHVSYTVTPSAGFALNVFEAHVSTRSSSTGATKGRLAYRIGGGAWVDEGVDHTLSTGGSCGASSTTWYWTLPAALSGITSNIEIAFYPYAATSNTGTVQVNQLELIGVVTSSVACSGTPIAGVITPSVTTACLSGYASLSFTGAAGPGIAYSWEQNIGGAGWTAITGASSTHYTSPTYTVVPTTIEYRVNTTCTVSGLTATSPISTFSVTAVPTAITGTPAYLNVGATATLGSTPGGGEWSSQNSAVASIGSASGIVTGVISGTTVVSYRTAGFSCYVVKTVNVIQPNTLSVYLGAGGTSTGTVSFSGVTSNSLTATGFGSNTPCGSGGLSGLTVATTVATYSSAGPNVIYTVTAPADGIHVDDIHATVRASGSGAQNFRIAYSVNSGPWVENTTDLSTDLENCGRSVNDNTHDVVGFGVNGNVRVGVWPFNPLLATGTFQLNSLDVVGYVCQPNDPIYDNNSSANLNGETYNKSCGNIIVSGGAEPGFSSNPFTSDNSAITVIPIDDFNATLDFDASITTDQVVTITFTNICNVPISATVTVSAGSAGAGCLGVPRPAPGAATVDNATDVSIYPNPATSTLNIVSAETVNVTVLSMDGKILMSNNNAKSVNVSSLASGLYMIQVYNTNSTLIKTAKFTKN